MSNTMQRRTETPVVLLRITDIRRDRVYQVRAKIDEDVVADYASIVRLWQQRVIDAQMSKCSGKVLAKLLDDIGPPFMDPVTVACILHPRVNPQGRPYGPLVE